jgi:AcrR family transcriptional regulator
VTARPRGDGTDSGAPREPVDGRRRRSQRSRERILAAVAQALEDPDIELTAEQVAARSGVSISTIFRHFGDAEGLARAMRQRLQARVLPLYEAGPFEGDVRARVRELLRRRTAIYETIAPLYRVTLRQPRGSAPREQKRLLEENMQRQLSQALGAELEGSGDLRAVLTAVLSFDVWNHMRTIQALDGRSVARLLEQTVLTLLGLASEANG